VGCNIKTSPAIFNPSFPFFLSLSSILCEVVAHIATARAVYYGEAKCGYDRSFRHQAGKGKHKEK